MGVRGPGGPRGPTGPRVSDTASSDTPHDLQQRQHLTVHFTREAMNFIWPC